MSVTSQEVKHTKGEPEFIVEHQTDPNFISPLEKYVALYCNNCKKFNGKCRLEDSRGLTPMSLCIMLFVGGFK